MNFKSKWIILLALLLVATMLFAACGDGIVPEGLGTNTGNNPGTNSGNNSGNNGGNSQSGQSEAQYNKDKATLESAGYSVTMYTDRQSLTAFESASSSQSLKPGSLEAYLIALKNDESQIVAFYFVSADDAAAYHAETPGSALNDKAVVFNDTHNLISSGNGNSGGNGNNGGETVTYSTGFDYDLVYDEITDTSGAAIAGATGCTDVDVFVPATRTNYFGEEQPYLWDVQNGFRSMPNAKTITIPEGFLEIRVGFGYSNLLEKITLPTSIRKLCSGVMQNCPSLETIEYQGTIEEWRAIEKEDGWGPDYTVVCSDGRLVAK